MATGQVQRYQKVRGRTDGFSPAELIAKAQSSLEMVLYMLHQRHGSESCRLYIRQSAKVEGCLFIAKN